MLSFNIETDPYGVMVLAVRFTGKTISINTELGEQVIPEVLEYDITDHYKEPAFFGTIYEQVNMYMTVLPLGLQEEVYEIFKHMYYKRYTDNYSDIIYTKAVEDAIGNASALLNYEKFKSWMVGLEAGIQMPENVLAEYVPDQDMTTTKEKTYIKSEYRDLVSLITFIRALSPVYLKYYNYFKERASFQYYKLFTLFSQSDLVDSEECVKLQEYIAANYLTLKGTARNEKLIIGAGLSDDDITDTLTAEVVFNKLISIDFFYKKCNAISYIFQTVRHKGDFVTPGSDNIRGKGSKTETGSEVTSYYEDHRKTSDVPIGTVAEIQHELAYIESIVSQLGYTKSFDRAMFEKEMENASVLMNIRLENIQIYLLGWFLGKAINARRLQYIEYAKLVELTLMAKVILINEGHTFMGCLLGSHVSTDNDNINILMRHSLNKTLLNNLKSSYSFAMEQDKQSNIEKSILEAAATISSNIWKPVYIRDQEKHLLVKEGYLEIPSNISDLICEYVALTNRN